MKYFECNYVCNADVVRMRGDVLRLRCKRNRLRVNLIAESDLGGLVTHR